MNETVRITRNWRPAVLVVFVLGTLLVALILPAIAQDPSYHLFIDNRAFFGVANFLNVLSNLPFLLAGYWGIRETAKVAQISTRRAWYTLFVGIALVSIGSSYYHLAPDNATLVWDRLPMTVGFMGLFAALMGEYFDQRLARWMLAPAVLLGVGAVAYWHLFDDLRLYAWVQFMPLGVILLLLLLYRSPFERRRPLALALLFYGLAKIAEFYDAAIYQLLGSTLSGHSLKHLLAAIACVALVAVVKEPRRQIGSHG